MIHIIDISCISPQETYQNGMFGNAIENYFGNLYYANEPNYKDLIPKGALRRMGKATRFGIGTGQPLIQRHPNLNGVIISTGNAGLGECAKFLDQLIKFDEGTLTPTHFVNSTANSIAGSLALSSKNTGYNATFVGDGTAFESALIDALMQFEEGSASKLLLGSVDEISDHNINIETNRRILKQKEVSSNSLFKSKSIGTVLGEGSAMFIGSKNPDNKLATVIDAGMIITPNPQEAEEALFQFLEKNNLNLNEIDTLVLGFNGDQNGDSIYTNLVRNNFPSQTVLSFKNLVGDYPTASGFAMWMITQQGKIPKEAIYRKGTSTGKHILIYNHYLNQQFGFILMTNPNLKLA